MALAAFIATGCGSSRALPAAGGQGGQAGQGGDAGRGGSAGAIDATAAAGGADAGDAALDAGVSGWPVTLRLVNAGTKNVFLPMELAMVCGFSISVAPAGGGDAHLISATPPDAWCNCKDCTPQRRFCMSDDLLCDGPMFTLAAGEHLDAVWDGGIAIQFAPPPPGSTCPSVCDHWETAAPGDYVFTIETLSGEFTAEASSLPTAGIVVLPINAGP
jgi:hypothetical protein